MEGAMNPQLLMVQQFLELMVRLAPVIDPILAARDAVRACVVELLLRMIEELLMPQISSWSVA
jgi:hypothetical protein